jgi:hypothetical protein
MRKLKATEEIDPSAQSAATIATEGKSSKGAKK